MARMEGCIVRDCDEPVLAEGVCYDHAKVCSRCDDPSRSGTCQNVYLCNRRLNQKIERDAHARGEW